TSYSIDMTCWYDYGTARTSSNHNLIIAVLQVLSCNRLSSKSTTSALPFRNLLRASYLPFQVQIRLVHMRYILVMTVSGALAISSTDSAIAMGFQAYQQAQDSVHDSAEKIGKPGGLLRGLTAAYKLDTDTADGEERVFGLEKMKEALANRDKVQLAKKLVADRAPMNRILGENIEPKQLYKALGFRKMLGIKYEQFKALKDADRTRVSQIINANEQLMSKATMLRQYEHVWTQNLRGATS
ncbi:hypothetical protein F444_01586, partial [Phytophthora nicotianae P1976]